ncbi:hypothetical protein HTT03_07200 [Sulfitobacter sp. S0837]|uniref:hypothetical protein n=1 Tax=Sulfitobacter maritimus TaxID=2741719 RepID=UPI0015829A95|nr:hypothetical protein [Sulfitobacter maritimus]NUH65083.1 hypothetical protein [Sulfitobacter maritimus]
MKIVILGTSNSVMGEKGFVRALRQRHEVVNLSAGRVGVAFHLNRIIEHYEMIESADLLIIDHYINDVNGFGPHLGDQYISDLNVLFDCLRCMNTHVINLLFPFITKENMDLKFYDVVVEGMRVRDLSFVDLNEIGFKRQHFLDEIHLTTGASYLMGIILAREVARLENAPKPIGGAIHDNPFKRYSISELIPGTPCLNHQNRLMSFDYLPLTGDLDLPFHHEESLYGVGYFTPKDHEGHQGISIGEDKIGLTCLPSNYFHENIETTTKGTVKLRPILGEDIKLESAMGRGTLNGKFEPPYLVDFTTRRHDIVFSGTPSRGMNVKVDMSGLLDALDYGVPTFLQPSLVDMIRDQALREETKDVAKAYALMQLAATLRPEGSLIKRKLMEYAEQISQIPSDTAGHNLASEVKPNLAKKACERVRRLFRTTK